MDDSVPPVKISDQGHGGTLDSDMVDGKHASELLAGAAGVGCIRADGSVPLVADWDVGGHQIKWFLFHKGTAFPTTPPPIEGQPFYRTDESKLYIYDGATWSELGGAPHDILDGSVHPDTATQAVTRGSIIVGSATPKWDELEIGGAAEYLRSGGTDPAYAAIPASEVVNTPAGGIAATDVQAALNELDGEKISDIEIQEDDGKVADVTIINFEGGGGKVTDEGGGKVTVDITPGGDGDGEEGHIHAYKEDKSAECDGAKITFITAQQFEPYTLRVLLNGQEQIDGMGDYAEGVLYDHFDMAIAPVGGDKLVAHYLAQRT